MKSVLGNVGRWLMRHKWWVMGAVALVAALILAPPVVMYLSSSGERFAAGDPRIPERDVALVLGAGVQPDGKPTPYLKRRLDSAVDLYKSGTVKVLLLSGDNRTIHYNEPVAMQRYVVSQGVPEYDTVLDYAGFNTYDSCYRARAIFNVKRAIIVSQAYHLPRAVWTCGHLGVESVGVSAKPAGEGGKDYTINYLIREIGSSDKAMIQTIFKPKPTLLGKFEPIEGIE